MKIGYVRVSTKDQTVALQVDALKKAGCTKAHTEVMSGSRSDRPVLVKLLENGVWGATEQKVRLSGQVGRPKSRRNGRLRIHIIG